MVDGGLGQGGDSRGSHLLSASRKDRQKQAMATA